ncbi:retinol-binding protein 1-like [Nerophis ophidion]|uniref:retinol-binding protein 1-like n=1 Tax=Nerophis ophidion TaxID=159077 RepID=UPI002AE0912A|nr:retinol-binding protein 1-like [Nerophis ophidion]
MRENFTVSHCFVADNIFTASQKKTFERDQIEIEEEANMSKPNYSGTFHMVEQENMDAYLAALDINFALRKIVCLLKPSKEIIHDPTSGSMKIRTLTTFKNFDMDFTIGQEFTEDLGPVDGRTCQTTVSWDVDKLLCVQKGEKAGRGWTHWLEGNKLHLEMRAEGVVARQVFKKAD